MVRARTLLATALLAGLAVGQTGCSAGEPTTVAASTAPVPSAASTETPTRSASAPAEGVDDETPEPAEGADNGEGGDGPILSGKRQTVIKPVGPGEEILAVNDKGRLVDTDGPGTHTLFVLVPVRDGLHQIRIAKAGAGGEPSCLGVKNNGSSPLTVVAAACDTSRAGSCSRYAERRRPPRTGTASAIRALTSRSAGPRG